MFGQAQQTTADRLIAAKGGVVTFITSSSVYDEDLLENVMAEARTVAPAVLGPGRSLVPGSLVEKADINVLVAARRLAQAPAVGDSVEVGDTRYRIVRVTPTYGGQLAIMYSVDGVAQ